MENVSDRICFQGGNGHRLYLWNAAVGQSFHFPLQTAEVALRNVIHQALVRDLTVPTGRRSRLVALPSLLIEPIISAEG